MYLDIIDASYNENWIDYNPENNRRNNEHRGKPFIIQCCALNIRLGINDKKASFQLDTLHIIEHYIDLRRLLSYE
jgi:hypothetical protein